MKDESARVVLDQERAPGMSRLFDDAFDNRAGRGEEAIYERQHRAPYAVKEGAVEQQPPGEIWVRSTDGVAGVADSLCSALTQMGHVDLACIGAASVNQANKGIAVARERLSHSGYDIYSQQFFSTIEWDDPDDPDRTRLMIRCFTRRIAPPAR